MNQRFVVSERDDQDRLIVYEKGDVSQCRKLDLYSIDSDTTLSTSTTLRNIANQFQSEMQENAELYIFRYSDNTQTEVLRDFARKASNGELSFSWNDAVVLARVVKHNWHSHLLDTVKIVDHAYND